MRQSARRAADKVGKGRDAKLTFCPGAKKRRTSGYLAVSTRSSSSTEGYLVVSPLLRVDLSAWRGASQASGRALRS